MKRVVQHPASSSTGPRYWRSLDELSQAPGFQSWMQREFPEGASTLDGVDRRHFLKIMAAGFAFAGVGMAGCRRPEAYIKTYAKQPEQVIPGQPTYYASAHPLRQDAIPLVVETHDARPTKLEGNPTFAAYRGATDLRTQASILDLYDPDRATRHTGAKGEQLSPAQVNDLLAAVHAAHLADNGASLAFLAESSSSPTRLRLQRALKAKFPKSLWAEYDSADYLNGQRAASAVTGRATRPVLQVAKAKRIVSFDSDFFFAEPGHLAHAKGFADGRRIESPEDAPKMNRLYAVESALTVTGSSADHRLRIEASNLPALVTVFAAQVFAKTGAKGPAAAATLQAAAGLDVGKHAAWLEAAADDLVAYKGTSLVVAGTHLSVELHALVLAVNEALGAFGHTLNLVAVDAEPAATLQQLAAAIEAGTVKTLVILGGNPAYNAPADLKWSALQAKVPQVLRHGYHHDETCAVPGTIHLAATHYLESWGDARTWDGTVVPVQPMILPLFPVLQEVELLARLSGEQAPDPYQSVVQTLATLQSVPVVEQFLHDGLLPDSAFKTVNRSWSAGAAAALIGKLQPSLSVFSAKSLDVRFVPDSRIDDGRFINNGWLQECPDPITKLSWDNAIIISPRLAGELGIVPPDAANQIAAKTANLFVRGRETCPLGTLTIGSASVTAPIHIQPGLANYTVLLPLGFGRTATGRVGTGSGTAFEPLRTVQAPFIAAGATLVLAGEMKTLANQQEHWSYEGRDIFREGNAKMYAEEPAFVKETGLESHTPPNYWNEKGSDDMPLFRKSAISTPRGTGLYETPDFAGPNAVQQGLHQWGMSIDLTTCIGCNACVIACQAENNIPIVGRDQVIRGREMHWIRLDRYFASEKGSMAELPEDPQVAIQPMTCQHCENAPCENVCPVNATVHDAEGLNVMAYNRCIGTRYCANNCPFKVRRFNFFDYNQRPIDSLYQGPLTDKGTPELVKMVKNPDVTVRMRGVMEKCTYCVQRIQQAKIKAKVKAGASPDVKVADGSIKTACEQVCPTEAIVFGDILDPNSRVSKLKVQPRDYAVLGYLNIRPRTTYLAKIRNPNPKIEDALKALGLPNTVEMPLGRKEYLEKNYPKGFSHGHGHGHSTEASLPTGHDHGVEAPAPKDH